MPSKTIRQNVLQQQVKRLDLRIAHLSQQSQHLSNLRLLVALLGIVVVTVTLFTPYQLVFYSALVISIGAFVGVVRYHRILQMHLNEHRGWQKIKLEQVARMTLDYDAMPRLALRQKQLAPIEVDLDMMQLYRVVNTGTSTSGTERLRHWLSDDTPDENLIANRQRIVRELIPQIIFRDKLILRSRMAANDLALGDNGESISKWLATTTPSSNIGNLLGALLLLAGINIVILVAIAFANVPVWVVLPSFIAYAALYIARLRRIATLFDDALSLEGALQRLQAILQHFEQSRYSKMPGVASLVQPITETNPSRQLSKATMVISGASLRVNPIFWFIINALIPWDYIFAYRFDKLRVELKTQLPQWLEIWHEVESLASLANFAYLNPEYTFPRVESHLPVVFDTSGLGHPLIPDEERVTNDFRLTDLGDTVLVTGSNMSGKSSFLRTIGVNLSLAFAGGVVNASLLDTIPFRLFTVIRVDDSLDDGISYFYAEVKRLKRLLDTLESARKLPVFFLIDEIFKGTNNRERLIGSRSLIQALTQKIGVGLISTHDLDLVKLARENPHIVNYHFREDIEDGKMIFDYMLRSGPSPTTNALRIMEMEGLPVSLN